MSEWLSTKLPCESCGSSDAFAISANLWGKCFSCGINVPPEDGSDRPTKKATKVSADSIPLISFGEYSALSARKLTEETCKKFGYFIAEHRGKPVQVAPYRNDAGEPCAQKVRGANKKFSTTGDFEDVALFGSHLWADGGRKLIITEGEIDCMTVSQLQGNKWPVVSIPSGAQSAASSIRRNLEFVMKYEEVIIMFDMDEPGRKAALEVAELLPVGTVKIAELPLKDPNECLVAGRGQEVVQAIWNAKEYRPDGIVDIDEILDAIEKPIEQGLPWSLPTLTRLTYGRRWGEIYGFGAGTGVGKTDLFTQQMAYDVTVLKEKVGVIYLEAGIVDTGKRIAGKVDGKRYHIPEAEYDPADLRKTLTSLKGQVTFYDSWGSTEWEVVADKIRYMVVSKGHRIIYLDHLTAMADTSNERESLEQIMKEMAGLANELQCIIHFISHLSTPEGKPHEEGGRVMIKHFKGSRTIGFWAHYLFALERDQQAEAEEDRYTTFRVLKDRYTGNATGKYFLLDYDQETGLLSELERSADEFGFDAEQNEQGGNAQPDF